MKKSDMDKTVSATNATSKGSGSFNCIRYGAVMPSAKAAKAEEPANPKIIGKLICPECGALDTEVLITDCKSYLVKCASCGTHILELV